MKLHTKVYFAFFRYDISDFIPCEICGGTANAIHHIDCRGMGGNPSGSKDVIENLMALCYNHHEVFGDKKQHMEFLYLTHCNFINKRMKSDKVMFINNELFESIISNGQINMEVYHEFCKEVKAKDGIDPDKLAGGLSTFTSWEELHRHIVVASIGANLFQLDIKRFYQLCFFMLLIYIFIDANYEEDDKKFNKDIVAFFENFKLLYGNHAIFSDESKYLEVFFQKGFTDNKEIVN